MVDRLRDELRAPQVTAFATPYVAFFLVGQPAHRERLDRAAAAVDSAWQGQIDILPAKQASFDAVREGLTKLRGAESEGGPAPARLVETETTVSSRFTPKQGQYLTFIYYYMKIHRVPPAEADFQRYFQVSPPVVHATIVTLEARGLIKRSPGEARSIQLRIPLIGSTRLGIGLAVAPSFEPGRLSNRQLAATAVV